MERILTSIDVGTSKICTVVAKMRDGRIVEVLGKGVVPSHGVHKAIVLDIAEPTAAIKESVAEAERSSGTEVKSAFIGITGHHIGAYNNRGAVAINRRDHRITQREVDRVLASSKSLPIPPEKRIIHAIPRQYFLDGEEVIGSPLRLHGYKLEVDTHIVTAGVTFIQNLAKCVQGAGISVSDLILESLASGEAVLEDEEKEAGVVLADIGAGTTDITVFKRRAIWHSRAISLGGYNVTKDVAIGLEVPFSVAEELKIKHAGIYPDESKSKEIPWGPEGRRTVRYEDLSHIVRARLEEIISLIFADLPRADWETWEPTVLVLCGGTANLPGLDRLGEGILGQRVRIGRPTGLPQGVGQFEDPAYATGIGLLLWGAKYGYAGRNNNVESVIKRFFAQLGRWRLSINWPRISFGGSRNGRRF